MANPHEMHSAISDAYDMKRERDRKTGEERKILQSTPRVPSSHSVSSPSATSGAASFALAVAPAGIKF